MQILIADDNQMVRRGISLLLSQERDWSICGEASNAEEVLGLSGELHPEIVLLDVSMPGMDGLGITRVLKQRLPDTKILIISQHDPHHLRRFSIEAGAEGCVDKARLATDLLPAIRTITAQLQPKQ